MPDASPKPFELREFVPFLMNRVGALMEQTIGPTLKREGLTLDMWRVLMVLHFNGPQTLVRLSRATGVKTPTLSRLVGRMIEKGLLSRRRSEEDGRTVQVSLRKQGGRLFHKLWSDAANSENVVTSSFDTAELQQLKSMLRRVEEVLTDYMAGSKRSRKPSAKSAAAKDK